MAGASITIDIIANDLVSPVISNLRGSYLGNFGADLTMAALNGVVDKIKSIGSAIADATKAQTKFISDANNLGLSTGLSLGLAESALDDINQRLAKNAAALPGATEDYVRLANAISTAFASGKNLQDPKELDKFKQGLTDIATQYTLISQAVPNLGAEATGDFVRRFLAGKEAWGSLKQLQFAQSNPAFENMLRQELGRRHKTIDQWTSLDQQTRFEVAEVIGKKVGNSGYIQRLLGTADAMMESVRSNLFDPLVGVFGFRRKLDEAGGRTVLDSFTGFLQSWLGLGTTVNGIAQKLGISFDPMQPLVDVIDYVTDIGTQADLWLSGMSFSQGFSSLDFSKPIVAIYQWWSEVWNSAIKGLLGFTFSFDTGKVVKTVVGFFESLFKGALNFQSTFDWTGFGRLIGIWLIKIPSFIIQSLIRFNWALIPLGLFQGLVAFFKFLGGLLLGVAEGIVREIPSLIQTWIDKIVDNFRFFFDGLKWLVDTLLGWIEEAKTTIQTPGKAAGKVIVKALPPQMQEAIENTPKPVKQATKAGVNFAIDSLIPGAGIIRRVLELPQLGKPKTEQDMSFNFGLPQLTLPSLGNDGTNLTTTPLNPNAGVRPLRMPTQNNKTQQVARTFAPQVSIYPQGQVDPEQLVNMVTDRIARDYDRYVQEQLA